MLKKAFKISISIFILFTSISILKIDNTYPITENIKIKQNKKNDIIGYIKIDKINLNKNLYKINSKENDIEKNIEILKESTMPNENNNILFLIAHSGESNVSYFNRLNELNINDEITINYKNNNYKYTVKDIIRENKSGYLNINKENTNQLVLTTCDPDNPYKKQLIINCIKTC